MVIIVTTVIADMEEPAATSFVISLGGFGGTVTALRFQGLGSNPSSAASYLGWASP